MGGWETTVSLGGCRLRSSMEDLETRVSRERLGDNGLSFKAERLLSLLGSREAMGE